MKNTITIEIELNENKIPKEITWIGSDGKEQVAKGMLLSFLDRTTKDTMKLDLWTEDLQIGEMDQLMYYTLRSLADTYINATGNKDLAEQMQQFAHHFGLATELFTDGIEKT
ncbi:MAG TPA: gliding motility protein GldC [Saprospiraceae bacterium]|nr:gliding motility protein GldC [Saprospiraceae bacterium]